MIPTLQPCPFVCCFISRKVLASLQTLKYYQQRARKFMSLNISPSNPLVLSPFPKWLFCHRPVPLEAIFIICVPPDLLLLADHSVHLRSQSHSLNDEGILPCSCSGLWGWLVPLGLAGGKVLVLGMLLTQGFDSGTHQVLGEGLQRCRLFSHPPHHQKAKGKLPWSSLSTMVLTFWPIMFTADELEKRKSQSSAMSPASPDPENQRYFQVQPWCCKLSLTEYITLASPSRAKWFCLHGNQPKFRDDFVVALLTLPHQILGKIPACLGCALTSAQTSSCIHTNEVDSAVLPLEVSKHMAKENCHYHSHFTGWITEGMWILHDLSGQCHCRKYKGDSQLPFQPITQFIMVLTPSWPVDICPLFCA